MSKIKSAKKLMLVAVLATVSLIAVLPEVSTSTDASNSFADDATSITLASLSAAAATGTGYYEITVISDPGVIISNDGVVSVTAKSNLIITFSAASRYSISTVKVDGVALSASQVSSGRYIFNNVTADHTIEVKSNARPITAISDSNSTISPSGEVFVPNGTDQIFHFSVSEGYVILSVTVDGVVQSESQIANGRYTFSKVTANHTIEVKSRLADYFINATADPNSTISPKGVVGLLNGASQAFTFSAKSGYFVSSVTVDGVPLSQSQMDLGKYTFTGLTSDHTIDIISSLYYITATADSKSSISPSGTVGVLKGSNQAFTFSAEAGYAISSVMIDGKALTSTQISKKSYTFSSVTADHTIEVSSNAMLITATADSNSTISPSGEVFVPSGTNQVFTFSANAGYLVSSVTVDGVPLSQTQIYSGRYTFSKIAADHTIEVQSHAPNQFITATSDLNSTISPNGTVEVLSGFDKTFTFSANTGYYITSVKVDGTSMSESQIALKKYTFANVTADHTIEVWSSPYYITATADANSTISPSGTVEVLKDSNQAFTFSANTGYYVSSVKVDGVPLNKVSLYNPKYTFSNITADHTIEIISSPYYITATADANSIISPNGTVEVLKGSNQAFKFSAKAGYYITSVKVDNNALTQIQIAQGKYIFTNVTADHTIEIKSSPYYITATADANSIISPSGTVEVLKGSNQTFTFYATGSDPITMVSVDGVLISQSEIALGSYTFINVTANHTIDVKSGYCYITAATDSHATISPSGVVQVPKGGGQEFTVSLQEGYSISSVMIDGTEVSLASSRTYTFTNVLEDHTFVVISKRTPPRIYYITATADSKTTISPSGKMEVLKDDHKTIYFSAVDGCEISSVTVDGRELSQEEVARGSYTFFYIHSNHIVNVKGTGTPLFAKFYISADDDSGSTISPSGKVEVLKGDSKTFSFSANPGYHISSVKVNGVELSPSQINQGTYTFSNVTADRTISVKSLPDNYIIATASSGTTIFPDGIVIVPVGGSQTFTFSASITSSILSVIVDGVALSPSQVALHEYTFYDVTTNHTIAVNGMYFEEWPNYITATDDSGSTVFPSGKIGVLRESITTFTFSANPGYYISSVIVNGKELSKSEIDSGSYTFAGPFKVLERPTIDVKSLPADYYITTSADRFSTISPSGTVGVPKGGNQTFTFAPISGYSISSVTVDGNALSLSEIDRGYYTFNSVVTNHSIDVKTTAPA